MSSTPAETISVPARKLPPIAELIMLSMALVITSGIYLASHLPHEASLGPVMILLSLATLSLFCAIGAMSKIKNFAWKAFFGVARWAILAYLVITGILEYVFIFDHTRGSMLLVLTLSLLIFLVDVPLLLSFSVARYQDA